MAYHVWRLRPVGMGHGPGLMLVPPLGRCVARVGGVRQVMPPWLGSWFVPLSAPWCAYCRGAGWCLGCGYGSVADAVRIVIHWAAELRCMVVSWFWLCRHGVWFG